MCEGAEGSFVEEGRREAEGAGPAAASRRQLRGDDEEPAA